MARNGNGVPRLLVVDWDGTVADSLPHIVRSWRAAFAETLGSAFVPESELVRRSVGLPVDLAVKFLWPAQTSERVPAIDDGTAAAVRAKYGELFRRGRHETGLFPQAKETLMWLKERGVLLAVATGKSKRGLDFEIELHGLTDVFAATRTASDSEAKPNPAMLLAILEDTHTLPTDAMMLGDATLDIAMARNAGVLPAGVSFGASERSTLLDEGAQLCFDSWKQIFDWFESR